MLPTENECRRITQRALNFTAADDASVGLSFGRGSHARSTTREPLASGVTQSVSVWARVTKDGRTGRVSLNETTDAALEKAMRRAEELAAVLPPDPESMGPIPPQKYLTIRAEDPATATAKAADRMSRVSKVLGPAAMENMDARGFFAAGGSVQCTANKAGNFGYHRATNAWFSATARTADGTGSGWAEDSSFRIKDIDAVGLAATALRKARQSAKPRRLDPGDYTVIFEPAAVADLIGFNIAGALSARAVEEGRSYFSKQGGGSMVGEKVFHESVTMKSDPLDKRRPGSPWGFGGGGVGGGFNGGGEGGLASAPITWVENGVLKNLIYDRYWAKQVGREPTPGAGNFVLEGGQETLASLIASTERGLLVTHFWYIRVVDPQTLQLTGVTRDGMWLIENGKIAYPVMNFRFNESPAVLLNNVLGMTPAVRTGNSVVPAIKAANFTFSSLSDAV